MIPAIAPETVNQFGMRRVRQSVHPAINASTIAGIHPPNVTMSWRLSPGLRLCENCKVFPAETQERVIAVANRSAEVLE